MQPMLTRRSAISAGAAGLLGVAAAPAAARAAGADEPELGEGALGAEYPTTSLARAQAIVGASHTDLDRVEELLAEDPSLARAAYDWGFGDWETALGAASHMGRPDIAQALISRGARPDLFTFAMLDQVDVVRACCEPNPAIQGALGPHGITLLAHARSGKAARVIAYLEALGGADAPRVSLPTSAAEIERYLGRYRFGPGGRDWWDVAPSRRGDVCTLTRAEDAVGRFLLRTGEHAFSPSGAPHVQVRFEVGGEKVTSLTIQGAGRRIDARRVE